MQRKVINPATVFNSLQYGFSQALEVPQGRRSYGGGGGTTGRGAPAGGAEPAGGGEYSDAPATSTEHDFDDDIPF